MSDCLATERRGRDVMVACGLGDQHDGHHFDSLLGIYWYKEGSGVREPRRSKPDHPVADVRRLFRVYRQSEPAQDPVGVAR